MSRREGTTPSELGESRVLNDRYELVERVGTGGMAEVWRARDRRLGRDVAIKLLWGPSASQSSMRRRIEREARALAALSHRNVVGVYDHGEAEDPSGDVRPYLVMEFVDGIDLHRYLEEKGPMSVDDAAALLRATLSAVGSAHDQGIVHGDLKPANVLLGPQGPKVGDFGVARILAEETGTTTVAATPSFAAPEVLRGERPSSASDLYSVACMGFTMLAGRPPYEGTNAWDVASKHLEDPVPFLRSIRPDIPPALDDALRRGMDKSPKRRHRTAQGFAATLDAIHATIPVAVAAPPTPSRADSTEVLGTGPALASAVFLGPLAGWGEAIRRRARVVLPKSRRRRGVLLLATVLLVAFLAAVLWTDGGTELVAVPDVLGAQTAAASQELSTRGFRVTVSYRPVTEGETDIVLETIPPAGRMFAPGSRIHIVASALTQTPAPVTPEPEPEPEPRGRDETARERVKRDKDDD